MESAIVDHIARFLITHRGKTLPLDMVQGCVNSLKTKQKKYIRKVGLKNFIVKHPDKFAFVDDQVILIFEPIIPQPIVQSNAVETPAPTPSKPSTKLVPPSNVAIESIKKEIQSSNFCMVCSDEMQVYAIGTCFHPICFKCSTKLRVLCNDRHCPVCRAQLTQVIFTYQLAHEGELRLSSFIKEQKYGIMFENQEIRGMHRSLLEHRCPKANCNKKYDDFDHLKEHMKSKHGEYFCDLCVRQCKKFTHERESFSSLELKEHEGSGDANSTSGNEGHPLCPFCDVRYLDRDELFRHLQQHHCFCHLCHESSHVFYMDIDQLWHEHHHVTHYACSDQNCYGVSNSVFKTEDELKKHVQEQHTAFNVPVKRREQAVDLNVTFGRRSGLQFDGDSRSAGFQLTPISGSQMFASPEGYLRSIGRVVNLTSCYGFVQRDGLSRNFADNVFFNLDACSLEPDDNLKNYFNEGDRVQVHAVKAGLNHRSKWRAIDVVLLPRNSSELDTMSVHSHTMSEVSYLTTDDFESPEPPSMDAFPALSSASNMGPIGPESTSNPTNWNNVVKSNKPKKVVKPPATTVVPSNSKKTTAKQSNEGIGTVHHNLQQYFGFITRSDNRFEDNIYFNLKAYEDGGGFKRDSVKDLTKELTVGEKVHYVLEEPDKTKKNAKAKYRASKVWKYASGTVEKTSEKSSAVPGLSVAKKAKPKKTTTTTNSEVKKKSKHKEKIGTAPVFTPPSVKVDDNIANNPPGPTSNQILELDTYEQSMGVDYGVTLNQIQSISDEEDIFRNLLVVLIGGQQNEDDILYNFDEELAINDVKTNQIAFIRFTEKGNPKIHSILFPANTVVKRHRQFQLSDVIGFDVNAVNALCDRDVLLKHDENLYYVNKSSFYITIQRNNDGSPVQLLLHTPFNSYI